MKRQVREKVAKGLAQFLANEEDLMDESIGVLISSTNARNEGEKGIEHELFSPPRLTREARRLGVKPGLNLDILQGPEFNALVLEGRKEIRAQIEGNEVGLLSLTPPCGSFSRLQNLQKHRTSALKESKKREGSVLLQFAREQANRYIQRGGIIVLEQPATASSWDRLPQRFTFEKGGHHGGHRPMCSRAHRWGWECPQEADRDHHQFTTHCTGTWATSMSG